MRFKRHSKCVWLAGASAMVIGLAAPAAVAQEDTGETQRTLSTVTVTTQKTEESIQDVPIAVSAFDEDALAKMQLAGGPDLVKSIPNVNFTKGNFTGYNFRIRGIGVDAVSTSADNGVGVHQNDIPLTSNNLFEAEFYDIERIEVLRGPQGTLYGRNATGGVFNLITAKPVLGEYQANIDLTYGNYDTFKAKGMVNVPIGESLAFRLAGSLLQRGGYVDNITTGNEIDDRDLFSVRATLAWEPTDRLRGWVSYEHFEEDDNRLRSGKQFCKKDANLTTFAGIAIEPDDQNITSLGCEDAPLSESKDRVNSTGTLAGSWGVVAGLSDGDVYLRPALSDERTIESVIDPRYQAETDFFSWKAEFDLTDSLLLTYLGSYNESERYSEEDYNKSVPDIPFNDLSAIPPGLSTQADLYNALFPGGFVSDPQLGTFNQLTTYDLSGGQSEQTTHEIRLQSDFSGRFNFNLGAISVNYETGGADDIGESYYVMSNTLTAITQFNNAVYQATYDAVIGGGGTADQAAAAAAAQAPFGGLTPVDTSGDGEGSLRGNINNLGRNYFRSVTPYKLDSFAVFGEGYYDLTDDLQLTVGLRYTSDDKTVQNIPTYLFTPVSVRPDPLVPVPSATSANGIVNKKFEEVTGRIGFDWSPDLSFSEDTLIYAFYSKGYKGGGINPPQPQGTPSIVPETFEPEFINAFEVGTKNTLANGALQLNATAFYYDYEGYQVSQIVNRTSANINVDAEIKGLELETIWNPASTFVVNANLGLLDAKVKDTEAIDVLDRTAGDPNYIALKNPFDASNCVISSQAYATVLGAIQGGLLAEGSTLGLCTGAFAGQESTFGLPEGSFTPGQGFAKDLDGNKLPGTPDMTLSLGAEYTWETVSNSNWDVRIRADYYYQADSYSRMWNTARDKLDSWENLNLSLQFYNDPSQIQVELFGKNVMDQDNITGAYLTDDSSGLFTNAYYNEPRTYGIRVSKTW
ncbi:TonB-dependent receptor [Hyphomonas pacifica]|nr:TonB-dependent receptor [Hyphomonas pacifica]